MVTVNVPRSWQLVPAAQRALAAGAGNPSGEVVPVCAGGAPPGAGWAAAVGEAAPVAGAEPAAGAAPEASATPGPAERAPSTRPTICSGYSDPSVVCPFP